MVSSLKQLLGSLESFISPFGSVTKTVNGLIKHSGKHPHPIIFLYLGKRPSGNPSDKCLYISSSTTHFQI